MIALYCTKNIPSTVLTRRHSSIQFLNINPPYRLQANNKMSLSTNNSTLKKIYRRICI
jgi:hypothetical protein